MRGDEHASYDDSPGAAAAGRGAPPAATRAGTAQAPDVHAVLHSRGYLVLLLATAVLALPLSALAFGFLAGGAVGCNGWSGTSCRPSSGGRRRPRGGRCRCWPWPGWPSARRSAGCPDAAGTCRPRAWAGDSTEPRDLAGVVLAALASLSLGAVIGPEAPLIALGGGLALLAADRTKLGADAQGRGLIAAAGSAAAIATIFGNPLVAVILMLEVVGLASRSVMLVIVPCIVSSGVGALLFTGLGHWTGLPTGSLALPDISATTLDAADLLLVIPLAAAVALLMHVVMLLGRRVATAAAPRPDPRRGRRRRADRRPGRAVRAGHRTVAGRGAGVRAGVPARTGRPDVAGRGPAAPAPVQGHGVRAVPGLVPWRLDLPGDLPRRGGGSARRTPARPRHACPAWGSAWPRAWSPSSGSR